MLATIESGEIRVLVRRRIELFDPAIAGSKQPYHAAEKMRFGDAVKFIASCKKARTKLSLEALSIFKASARSLNVRLAGLCVVTSSRNKQPILKRVLSSHALIHAAEGRFYQIGILEAAGSHKVSAIQIN